ncbi:MAG TPA: glycosyltransferase family 2 protein [Gammaproteobacteria bacterium]|nr:glycosyltransferase family 2 protein [Gammaproteobacteria bacterium]
MPTYNEAENIAPMLNAIAREAAAIQHDIEVLVVDDNSPDDTASIVRVKQQEYPNVHLITGEKKGLGAAYLRGMRHALNVLDADAVFEMDADFSHDPADLKRLINALEAGADFVIGSRYVEGGTIPDDWGLMRKLNSRCGNFVARHLAGIYQVRDCTAGFRLIRASVLNNINFDAIRPQGYAFQVALLHEAVLQNANIVEIPVHFTDRKYGDSKLGLSDILEFLVQAGGIRLRSMATFIKFCIVGTSGVIVNLGTLTLLLALGMNKFIASPIAIEMSIISNFLLNNYWTFRWRKTRDRVRVKGLKFNVVSFLSLFISYMTFVILALMFPDVAPQIHQLIGIIPATFVNYFLNSYWTFSIEKKKSVVN